MDMVPAKSDVNGCNRKGQQPKNPIYIGPDLSYYIFRNCLF